jgi:hypothetical protein
MIGLTFSRHKQEGEPPLPPPVVPSLSPQQAEHLIAEARVQIRKKAYQAAQATLNSVLSETSAGSPQSSEAADLLKKVAPIAARQLEAQILARRISARQNYAEQLEQSLLSRGLDAHVTVVGQGKDTLRISWAAMSRPVVYNMINSEGMQSQVPSLGFNKVIMTDDGSFSGASTESWVYRWDGHKWHQ